MSACIWLCHTHQLILWYLQLMFPFCWTFTSTFLFLNSSIESDCHHWHCPKWNVKQNFYFHHQSVFQGPNRWKCCSAATVGLHIHCYRCQQQETQMPQRMWKMILSKIWKIPRENGLCTHDWGEVCTFIPPNKLWEADVTQPCSVLWMSGGCNGGAVVHGLKGLLVKASSTPISSGSLTVALCSSSRKNFPLRWTFKQEWNNFLLCWIHTSTQILPHCHRRPHRRTGVGAGSLQVYWSAYTCNIIRELVHLD